MHIIWLLFTTLVQRVLCTFYNVEIIINSFSLLIRLPDIAIAVSADVGRTPMVLPKPVHAITDFQGIGHEITVPLIV
jgi:hypothetical protein